MNVNIFFVGFILC